MNIHPMNLDRHVSRMDDMIDNVFRVLILIFLASTSLIFYMIQDYCANLFNLIQSLLT